jgi:hypothetical protein
MLAQNTAPSENHSAETQKFIRTSNWTPFNAYSIAPSSNKDLLELSAMPINWAAGIALGKSDVKFVRLSLIANWRIEYKVEYEQESFSLENAGFGTMLDYGGLFYAGVVFPVEVPTFKAGMPEVLIGVQLSLAE